MWTLPRFLVTFLERLRPAICQIQVQKELESRRPGVTGPSELRDKERQDR